MKKLTNTEELEEKKDSLEKEHGETVAKPKRSQKAAKIKKEEALKKEEKMIVAEEKSRKVLEDITIPHQSSGVEMELDKAHLSAPAPKIKSPAQTRMEEKAYYTQHRQRMKEQFLKNGLSGLSPQRVTELVLFYAIPQKDVYQLANKLIDTFGSFLHVLRAPYEELLKIKGIGEHSAFLIKLVDELVRYVLEYEVDPMEKVTKKDDAYNHLKSYFYAQEREAFCVLCLDGDMNRLGVSTVGNGSLLSVGLDLRLLVEEVLRFNATHVYLAHNHVTGPVTPSSADWAATESVMETLHSIDVCVIDHLIIGRETYASMRKIAQTQKIPLPWPK